MEMTLEAIKLWCEVDIDGHWIWSGSGSKAKTPKANFGGRVMTVRRAILEIRGQEIPNGYVATNKCPIYNCVAPDCVVCVPKRKERLMSVKRNGGATLAQVLGNRAAVMKGKVGVKLNMEKAQEIIYKCSEEGVRRADVAKEYGVSIRSVDEIIAGKRWKSMTQSSAFNPLMFTR